MSKFSEEFEGQCKDVKSVRQKTKEIIDQGGKLAFKEVQDAHSVERIKKILRK